MYKLLSFLLVVPSLAAQDAANGDVGQDVAALYNEACSGCHDSGAPRMPARAVLAKLPPEAIVRAMEGGPMTLQAMLLTPAERRAVAEYVSGRKLAAAPVDPSAGRCRETVRPGLDGARWNGWGADLANTRFQPSPGLKAEDLPRLKVKWAFGFLDDIAAQAQPAVAGGRVFTGSAHSKVYALDAVSGCIRWAFEADAPVRSGIVVSESGVAYFGDLKTNVYGVDAAGGRQRWKTRIDDHAFARITGSPVLYEGRLYVPVASMEEGPGGDPHYPCCTSRGSVAALDAASGQVLWKSYTVPETPQPTGKNKYGTPRLGPSGAGVWSAPTLDLKRRALYVATGDNYSDPPTRTSDAILAIDMESGKLLWSRQMTPGDAWNASCLQPERANCPETSGPDFDFGSSPILVDLSNGKRALIAGQKSGFVHAVDPDQQGEVLWQVRIGKGGALGGVQWGPAADARSVYVALSDVVFRARELDGVGVAGQLVLEPNGGGGLFALDVRSGKRAWFAPPASCGDRKQCSPAQSAAVTAMPGAVFSGSMDGHLRAYSTRNGRVLWDYDTVREYTTVNRVKASGGALDAAGPAIAGGMVFVNSGYGKWGGLPGNVLLAFSVDGK